MQSKIRKAMVLVAGKGERLRPLTDSTPKPLLDIGGRPLIEHIIGWLVKFGIREVVLNLHHLGQMIEEKLGNGSSLGVSISYSHEEELLGTAGGVKNAERFFDGPFVVVYGDVLPYVDLDRMSRFHQEKGGAATLALFRAGDRRDIGAVETNEVGRIVTFVERPTAVDRETNLGNGGVYILEKRVLDYVPAGVPSDFAYDIFPRLLTEGIPLYGYVLSPGEYTLDIGTMERYQRVNADIKSGTIELAYAR